MDTIGENTIKGAVDDIKVDLIGHKYKLISPMLDIEGT